MTKNKNFLLLFFHFYYGWSLYALGGARFALHASDAKGSTMKKFPSRCVFLLFVYSSFEGSSSLVKIVLTSLKYSENRDRIDSLRIQP